MGISKEQEEREDLEITRQYRQLLKVWETRKDSSDESIVFDAFRLAVDAHKEMRRKSGEPFIMHPIAVAIIAAQEIGLGRTSIIAALLHDTVEDTKVKLEDIEKQFGKKVSNIIDGLTKIDDLNIETSTAQIETVKKILLTMSSDLRVVIIKLADRLHNMRTIGSMPYRSKMRMISETSYLYIPIAYTLGLYNLKSELEELSFKHAYPDQYDEIRAKLTNSADKRRKSFEITKIKLENDLKKIGYNSKIIRNTKSAVSIFNKMKKSQLSFKNIQNTYSIDIIIDASIENENAACWIAYAAISTKWKTKIGGLKDWISTPKSNAYQAIHFTIMNTEGQWVDIHIRSIRMNDIANKGYAAYWKYKDIYKSSLNFDTILDKIALHINDEQNEESHDSFKFVNNLKKDLFSNEISVYTPTGEKITMPFGSTVLDFAYTIHTDLGNSCMGGLVNTEIKPIGYKLNTGEQVEILPSEDQKPNENWFKHASTANAKAKIAEYIKNQRKEYKKIGKEKLNNYFNILKIENTKNNVNKLLEGSSITGLIDLYFHIAKNTFGLKDVKEIMTPSKSRTSWVDTLKKPFTKPKITKKIDKFSELTYSECCNPLPDDNIVHLSFQNEPIQVHKTNCKNAIRLIAEHGKDIVVAECKLKDNTTFITGIRISAKDSHGLIMKLITPITNELNINIKSLKSNSNQGIANIDIAVYVNSLKSLNNLITILSKIKSVIKVKRLYKV